jgi:ankyrin repeat protein
MGQLVATENISRKTSLLTLPNELLLEVAAHLERFRDLNSLLRSSRFFHILLHTLLYRRAMAPNNMIRDYIIYWVLVKHPVASLMHLLDNGLSANYMFERDDGDDLLHTLCRVRDNGRSVSLARLLLERGADIEAKDATYSKTVLQAAVRSNNSEIVALLLAHGADVNAVDTNGSSPLHDAFAFYVHRDIITLLVTHGADVNAANMDGITPLHNAVDRGNGDIATLLLVHGADVNARSPNGDTPLLRGLRDAQFVTFRNRGTGDVIRVLLAHGADACAHGVRGETPLHVLSAYTYDDDDLELAKLLLDCGADVNAIDFAGRTPLRFISRHGGFDWDGKLFMAQFLLENGADVNA